MNIFTNEELLADISGLNKTIDHLTAELSQVKAERDRMREALVSIEEYWNRSENDNAMNDALYYMIETAQQALAEEEK